MLPTILIGLVLAVLLFLAVRRLFKKGGCDCSSCDAAGTCPGSTPNNGKP